MKSAPLGKTGLDASRLVYGCMRLADGDDEKGLTAIRTALDAGYTHFDHADIYGRGASEALFGRFLSSNPGVRDGIVITSKCGIRFAGEPSPDSPQRYDFSADHLTAAVDGSLRRLNVEYLDVLLLHRPDYLMNADEVAAAFDALKRGGKVRYFGVSNFSASQVALVQSRVAEPLCVNQLEINLRNLEAFTNGTLEQCQRLNMTPQAWSPLSGVVHVGWGPQMSPETATRVRDEIDRQAQKYASTDWLVVLAWLLFHPAGITPIVGSTSPQRIRAAAAALALDYQRDDWYRLLEARVGEPVP